MCVRKTFTDLLPIALMHHASLCCGHVMILLAPKPLSTGDGHYWDWNNGGRRTTSLDLFYVFAPWGKRCCCALWEDIIKWGGFVMLPSSWPNADENSTHHHNFSNKNSGVFFFFFFSVVFYGKCWSLSGDFLYHRGTFSYICSYIRRKAARARFLSWYICMLPPPSARSYHPAHISDSFLPSFSIAPLVGEREPCQQEKLIIISKTLEEEKCDLAHSQRIKVKEKMKKVFVQKQDTWLKQKGKVFPRSSSHISRKENPTKNMLNNGRFVGKYVMLSLPNCYYFFLLLSLSPIHISQRVERWWGRVGAT